MILKTITLVDTCEFQRWAEEKYGFSNSTWHDLIWNNNAGETGLCDYILDCNHYVTFQRLENPKSLLELHINCFLDDFPELCDKVSFIFTN